VVSRSTFLALALVWVVCTVAQAKVPGFVPQWHKGDRWLISAQRRLPVGALDDSPRGAGRKWSVSLLWAFEVINTRDKDGMRFFHIIGRSWREPSPEEVALLFVGRIQSGMGLVESLSLVQAAFRDTSGLHVDKIFSKYSRQAYPIINDFSTIPVSFPLFSANKLAGTPKAERFEVTERKATLFFARDVVQYVISPPSERWAKMQLKLRQKIKTKDIIQVNLSRPSDGRADVQLWHAKYPWPLFSQSGSTRCWLVKVSRSKARND